MTITHYCRESHHYLHVAICGTAVVKRLINTDPEKVTCSTCKSLLVSEVLLTLYARPEE